MGNTPVLPNSDEKATHTSTVYTFHASRQLPVLDGTKSVKHVLLSQAGLQHFNRFLHFARGWITLAYTIGFALSVGVFAVDAHIGAWLAIGTLLLQLPACVVAYLVLRYDFVVLVSKTFEFWYAVAVNILCVIVMWFAFSDWRMAMILSSGIAYEIPFLMDAVHRGTRATIVASMVGAALDVADITLMTFSLMRDVHTVTMYTAKNFRIEAADIVLNGLGTVVVLLIRNAYRKYRVLIDQHKTRPLRGSFIMYRCCLQLRLKTSDEVVCRPDAGSSATSQPTLRRLALFFDRSDKSFDARRVMWPRAFGTVQLTPWPRYLQYSLRIVGLIGQAAIVLANHSALTSKPPDPIILSFACISSFVFCGAYFVHAQRDLLLRELCGSFDFVFMAFQFTVSHLSGCIMFEWDMRCLLLVASWLWSLWLITLDAVTPVMKRKLGFNAHGAIVIVLVQLLEQILVVVAVLYFDPFNGRDYSLVVVRLAGREKTVRVVQFLLWRMVTCFLWSSRILWRLLDRKGDELIVLQGRVEYMEPERRSRKVGEKPNRTPQERPSKSGRTAPAELAASPGP